MNGNITIDDIVDNVIDENDILVDFLGYKPDTETLNNGQLLREELENVAKQMPDEELAKFYKLCQQRAVEREIKNYLATETQILLNAMNSYVNDMKGKPSMKPIVDITTDAITKINECIARMAKTENEHNI